MSGLPTDELRQLAVRAERAQRAYQATKPALARRFGDARTAAVLIAQRQGAAEADPQTVTPSAVADKQASYSVGSAA